MQRLQDDYLAAYRSMKLGGTGSDETFPILAPEIRECSVCPRISPNFGYAARTNQIARAASPPTLAKNARMGHPLWEC